MTRKILTRDDLETKELSKKEIEKDVIKQLKGLGIYKEEYEDIIKVYSGLLQQYKTFEKQFELDGFQVEEDYTNKAGATNKRKTPIYSAMEGLRKDLITYSDRLGLNPKSLESITAEKDSGSRLEKALANL